jgi:undecaprenyl-diphosphatase
VAKDVPERSRGYWITQRVPEPLLSLVELRVLLAIAGIALAAWSFAALYDEVHEGDLRTFDQQVLLLFRTPGAPEQVWGPPWVQSAIRDLTALGGTPLVVSFTLAVAGYLVMAGKPGAAVFVLVAILGAAVLSFTAKDLIVRPRPELVPHAVTVVTSSFPSGHATGAAATYLTLGALLARFQPRRRLKIYLLTLAVIITVAVGLSRLYLGVHWPSDVLAGWTLGSGWALTCWVVARILQRRGRIEPTSNAEADEDATATS